MTTLAVQKHFLENFICDNILKDCDELQKYLITAIQETSIIEKFNQFAQECSDNL